MSKINVHYKDCLPDDIQFLKRFEPIIQKAMPIALGLMTDACWDVDPSPRSQRYFRLFVHNQPEKMIGGFGKAYLEKVSAEDFYHELEKVGFTDPTFRPKGRS